MAETLWLNVHVNDRALRDLERHMGRSNSRLARGAALTAKAVAGIGIAAAAAGTAAYKMYEDYERSTTKLISLVGVSRKQMHQWQKDMLRMSVEVGKSPTELADAMYFVTSAGLRGAKALDTLRYSAKLAAAGMGETKEVADAVTSAMNAWGKSNMTAARASDVLVATVTQGKVEASALAPVIGKVSAMAAEMGVSFEEVGAALASQTRLGTNAARSAQGLEVIFRSLLKENSRGAKALDSHGLSYQKLRDTLKKPDGLLKTLELLREAFRDDLPGLAQVMQARGLTAFLALMGKNVDSTRKVFDKLGKSVGAADRAFAVASKTGAVRWARVVNGLKAAFITLGAMVEPVFTKLSYAAIKGVQGLQSTLDKMAAAKTFKAKVGIVWGDIESASQELWTKLFGGTRRTARMGRVVSVEGMVDVKGMAEKIAASFEQIDWTPVGKSIVAGLGAALQASVQFAKDFASWMARMLRSIDFTALGRQMGPGFLAMMVTAFTSFFDPVFWVKNWDLALSVMLVVFSGSIGRMAGRLLTAMVRPLSPVFAKAGELVVKLFGERGAQRIGWAIGNWAKLAGYEIAKLATYLLNRVSQLFGKLAGVARFTIKVFGVQAAINAVVGFARTVGGWFKTLGSWVAAWATKVAGFLGKLGGTLGGFVSDALTPFRSAWGKVNEAIGWVIAKIKWLIDNAKKVTGIFGWVAGKIGGGGDGLLSAAKQNFGWQRIGAVPGGLSPVMAGPLGLATSMGLVLTSGYRPGAVTATGNQSLHAVGRAIDVAGAPAQMAAFARAVAGKPGVREVLYTPVGGWYPGAGWTGLTGTLASQHYSHVHVGMGDGVVGTGRIVAAARGDGRIGAGALTTGSNPNWAKELTAGLAKAKAAIEAMTGALAALRGARGALGGVAANVRIPNVDAFGRVLGMLSGSKLRDRLNELGKELRAAFASGNQDRIQAIRDKIDGLTDSISQLRENTTALKQARERIDQLAAAAKNIPTGTLVELRDEWGQLTETFTPDQIIARLNTLRAALKQVVRPEDIERINGQIETLSSVIGEGFTNAATTAQTAIDQLHDTFGKVTERALRVYDAKTEKMLSAIDDGLTAQIGTLDADLKTAMDTVDATLTGSLDQLDKDLQHQLDQVDANLKASTAAIDAWAAERTPTELQLFELTSSHDAAARAKQLADAQAELQAAQDRYLLLQKRGASKTTLDAQAKTVADAQAALDELLYQAKVDALTEQAKLERDAKDAEADARKEAAQKAADDQKTQYQNLLEQAKTAANYMADQQKDELQKAYDTNRLAAENEAAARKLELQSLRDEERIAFEAALADAEGDQQKLLAALAKYGVDYAATGNLLGSAFGSAYLAQINAYIEAANKAVQTKTPTAPFINPAGTTYTGGGSPGDPGYWSYVFPFQHGGVVRKPTFGLVGEAGPEAVIPLDRLNQGMTVNVYLDVDGAIGDPDAIGRALAAPIRRELLKTGLHNTGLWN